VQDPERHPPLAGRPAAALHRRADAADDVDRRGDAAGDEGGGAQQVLEHHAARGGPGDVDALLVSRQLARDELEDLLDVADVVDAGVDAVAHGAVPERKRPERALEQVVVGAGRLGVDDDGLVAQLPGGEGVPHGRRVGGGDGVAGLLGDLPHGGPVHAVHVHPDGVLGGAVVGLGEEDVEGALAAWWGWVEGWVRRGVLVSRGDGVVRGDGWGRGEEGLIDGC